MFSAVAGNLAFRQQINLHDVVFALLRFHIFWIFCVDLPQTNNVPNCNVISITANTDKEVVYVESLSGFVVYLPVYVEDGSVKVVSIMTSH